MVCLAHNASSEEDASNGSKSAHKYYHKAEKNVGFKVLLEVAEELGTCDKADRGNEEDKSEIFHDLERV